jgi:plasmid replication initiation protein
LIQALTRQDVPILSKTFRTPRQAKSWASSEGRRHGAHRVVQQTARGPRTIWRAPSERTACGDGAERVHEGGLRDENHPPTSLGEE